MKSGQIVVLSPFASMYQLEHPPEFHTVGGSLRCSASFQWRNASGRTVSAWVPSRRIVRSASIT